MQNNKFAKTFFLTLQHQGNINQNRNVSSVCANTTEVWLLCKSEGASENSQFEGQNWKEKVVAESIF